MHIPTSQKEKVLISRQMYGKCKEKKNVSYEWKRKTNTRKK
jgi:hypothetical protein